MGSIRLERGDPFAQMIGCVMRIAERHCDIAMPREGRHFGMNSLNQALERLHQARLVTFEDAVASSPNPQELRQMIRREGTA